MTYTVKAARETSRGVVGKNFQVGESVDYGKDHYLDSSY